MAKNKTPRNSEGSEDSEKFEKTKKLLETKEIEETDKVEEQEKTERTDKIQLNLYWWKPFLAASALISIPFTISNSQKSFASIYFFEEFNFIFESTLWIGLLIITTVVLRSFVIFSKGSNIEQKLNHVASIIFAITSFYFIFFVEGKWGIVIGLFGVTFTLFFQLKIRFSQLKYRRWYKLMIILIGLIIPSIIAAVVLAKYENKVHIPVIVKSNHLIHIPTSRSNLTGYWIIIENRSSQPAIGIVHFSELKDSIIGTYITPHAEINFLRISKLDSNSKLKGTWTNPTRNTEGEFEFNLSPNGTLRGSYSYENKSIKWNAKRKNDPRILEEITYKIFHPNLKPPEKIEIDTTRFTPVGSGYVYLGEVHENKWSKVFYPNPSLAKTNYKSSFSLNKINTHKGFNIYKNPKIEIGKGSSQTRKGYNYKFIGDIILKKDGDKKRAWIKVQLTI